MIFPVIMGELPIRLDVLLGLQRRSVMILQ